MTPSELAEGATAALAAGTNMLITHRRGVKMPPKFYRGELLYESRKGAHVYSYDPAKVLVWLAANGLIEVKENEK